MNKFVQRLALFGFIAVNFTSLVSAQEKVDPEVRARLDKSFAGAHPQPGDYLPDIDLDLLAKEGDKSSIRYSGHAPLKLVLTASLTCPKTREHLPAVQDLKKKFGEKLSITLVYVIEAHPEIDICPYLGVVDVTEANIRDKILFRQPTTMEMRRTLAKEFALQYPLDCTCLIDSMDDKAWRVLGQSPNAALLADADGQVVLRQGWLEPQSLAEAISEKLKRLDQISKREIKKEAEAYKVLLKSVAVDLRLESSQAKVVKDTRLESEDDELVNWFRKANKDDLKDLLEKYPKLLNAPLIHGSRNQEKDSLLTLMIKANDLAGVKIVCEEGADVNHRIQNEAPLSLAVQDNRLSIVKYLLKKGASPKTCTLRDFSSLLHCAVWEGNLELASVLMEAGLKEDAFTDCGMGKLEELSKRCEASRNDAFAFDRLGRLPLSFAIRRNQSVIVRFLLDRKFVVDARQDYETDPVFLANRYADVAILRMLLKYGCSPDHAGVLNDVLNAGSYEKFRLLLEAKVSLDAKRQGEFALHQAISKDLPTKFLVDLLEYGAEIDQLTVRYSTDDCGPSDPKSSLETPLHIAARKLRPEHAAILIQRKAKLENVDQSGLTPLGAAILSTLLKDDQSDQGLRTIRILVEGGASVDAKDSTGRPLKEAIEQVTKMPESSYSKPKSKESFFQKHHPPFEVEEKSYLGPHGLDASQIVKTPLLSQINEILVRRENP